MAPTFRTPKNGVYYPVWFRLRRLEKILKYRIFAQSSFQSALVCLSQDAMAVNVSAPRGRGASVKFCVIPAERDYPPAVAGCADTAPARGEPQGGFGVAALRGDVPRADRRNMSSIRRLGSQTCYAASPITRFRASTKSWAISDQFVL
jgi:hypothetical protein